MKQRLLFCLSLFTISIMSYSQGSDCSTADAFCTGTTFNFPNTTGVPDQGTVGCLSTTPNPAWYYLQIDNPGNIDIHIEQYDNNGNPIDVDFIVWGPFTSQAAACASNLFSNSGVDCSYSASATEDANIVGAQAGEVYVMLLTNYADDPGNITFSQTGGAGSTDCSVVCSAPALTVGTTQSLTCVSTTASLSANSVVAGVTYSWTGPGGFVSSSQNPTVSVAGTYTVTVIDPTNPTCPATGTQVVTANNTPPNLVVGTTQSITCLVSSVSLNANSTTSGVSYSWSGPGITGGATSGTPTVNAAGTYTVVITDPSSGCTSTATQDVILNNTVPDLTMGGTQQIDCTSPTASLSASSSTSGVTYSWSGAGIIAGGTTATPTANAGGTYTVTITNPTNGCTATGTQDVTASGTFPNVSTGAQDTLTCTVLSLSLSGNSTTPNATYSWTGPGIVSGAATANPTVNAGGTYTLTVTDPSNGCMVTATQIVISNTTPPLAVAGNDLILPCNVASIALNGAGSSLGADFAYNWSTTNGSVASGANTLTPSVSQAGTYIVTVTNTSNGCTSTDTVIVTPEPFPTASFTTNPSSGTVPLTVNFANTSTNTTSFVWDFDNGQTSVLNNPSIIYSAPGTYTVMLVVTNVNGCVDTAFFDITVFELSGLVVPNVFTPNGDGSNDYFKPVVAQGLSKFEMSIYDRWGLKISEVTNATLGWDGNSKNGSAAPDGTYYFMVDAEGVDGKKYEFNGYVSLIRAK